MIYFEKIKEKAQALPEEATGALEPQQAESTDGFGTNTITLALISCSMTANSHNRITEV